MIEYRDAQRPDADAVARLHAQSWRESYRGSFTDAFLDDEQPAERIGVWRERLGRPAPNQLVRLAFAGADLMGFVCVYAARDPDWGSLIDNLHVRHDATKRGTGAALMRAAAEWCWTAYPARPIHLLVLRANANALAFYDRLGGTNAEEDERQQHGGGIAYGYRYTWPNAQAILDRTQSPD